MIIESINIGNLFLGRNNEICSVININTEDISFVDIRNKEGVVYREAFDSLRPIQLNEDWLINKFGYVKSKHSTISVTYDSDGSKVENSKVLVLYDIKRISEDGTTYQQTLTPGKIEEGYCSPNGLVACYVNELQNYTTTALRKPLKIEY